VAEHEQYASIKLPLFSAGDESGGEIELAGQVFANQGNASLLHEAVRMQMANRRFGTASTKTRGLISGGGKKPYRQKGTGNARAGSTRSPLWRKGGTIFGPLPRDYSYKMPKKALSKALCIALSDRARQGKLLVCEKLELAELKTKAAKAALDKLGVKHALIVIGKDEARFGRAARNLAAHKVLDAAGLNVYDVLKYDELVLSAAVAKSIEARLMGRAHQEVSNG
jgi:large subunit ribosomal protein L4